MATRKNRETVLTKKHVARLERERRQSKIVQWLAIGIAAFILIGLPVILFLDGTISLGNFNVNYVMRNRPVARIGDEVATLNDFQVNVRLQRQSLLNQYITYSQYAQFGLDVSQQLTQIESQLAPESSETIGQNVVDSLVNDLLIRQEAKKRGITVNEEDVQARIREIFGYYPDGSPTPTLTPTEIVFPTLSAKQLAIVSLTPTETATPEGTLTETPVPTSTST